MLEKFHYGNFQNIIGVDEAGRGCLAGRVYAAAVWMPVKDNEGIYQDSKKLSEKKREDLYERIIAEHPYGIAYASVEEIEEINILNAAMLAMKRAVDIIQKDYDQVLVDGNKLIPYLDESLQTFVIKGDQIVPAISAASILAKVARDRYVYQLSEAYPDYGFERHKAYATKAHKEAIAKWGPCKEHRKTFAGVKEFL